MKPNKIWLLRGRLTLETLESILSTLREEGEVHITCERDGYFIPEIPSLAQLALEATKLVQK